MCNIVEGLPNTSGMLIRRDVKSSQDADVIALMRRAGAIPVAVTNMSELCMWYESSNFIYGRTNNAYHHGRTAGGSSGHTTAATASPFTIREILCSVVYNRLCCVQQLCTMIRTHLQAVLKFLCWFRFTFRFCVFFV